MRRLIGIGIATVVLSGCLNVSTVIRVSPDGSGTIEQVTLFNPRNIEEAFKGIGFSKSASSSSSSKAPVMDERSVREAVATLGEGVSVVSVVPVTLEDGFAGVRAKFAFTDITRLQSEDLLIPGPARAEMDGTPGQALKFAFVRGTNGESVLTVAFDETAGKSGKGTAKASKSGPGGDDADVQQMMKTLFRGFRMGLDIEINGQILETDADYVTDRRITVVQVDESLLRNVKQFDDIQRVIGPDASIAKARPYFKDVKGLKINRPVMRIVFK